MATPLRTFVQIPTLLFYVHGDTTPNLQLSRSISIGLLFLYVLYIYFQLHTHRDFFDVRHVCRAMLG